MPPSEEILAGLHRIANELFMLAAAYHLVILGTIAALLTGWRPSQRHAVLLLTLPLACVAVVGFVYRNPFNGAAFAVLALALAIRARRVRTERVALGAWPSVVSGAILVGFGSVYPHFLDVQSAWVYLIGAPVGLVPCPSLALVLGFALLAGGFGDRTVSLMLSIAGLFYGLFGVARLGVRLDFALLAGALALAWLALHVLPSAKPLPVRRAEH
jgi:hypothetical protein